MGRLVTFDAPTERLVRFVEDTPPAEIVEATYRELESGAAPREMLMAAGLAVSRSTELPNQHHGGPVHPVSGLHALVQRLAQPVLGIRLPTPFGEWLWTLMKRDDADVAAERVPLERRLNPDVRRSGERRVGEGV